MTENDLVVMACIQKYGWLRAKAIKQLTKPSNSHRHVNKLRVLGLVKKGPGYHPIQRLRFGLTAYAAENRFVHEHLKLTAKIIENALFGAIPVKQSARIIPLEKMTITRDADKFRKMVTKHLETAQIVIEAKHSQFWLPSMLSSNINSIKIKREHVVIDRNITEEIIPWQYICIDRQVLHIVPAFKHKDRDFIAFTTTDLVLISYSLGQTRSVLNHMVD